jgi:hypothetical protein
MTKPIATSETGNGRADDHLIMEAERQGEDQVKVIAEVPRRLKEGLFSRLKAEGLTYKEWLTVQMEDYCEATPLRDPLTRLQQRSAKLT